MNAPIKKRFTKTGNGKAMPLKGMLNVSPKELRKQLHLTQSDFWAPVGVSQSGGSRYESGRKLPSSTSALLHLVHIEGVNISQICGDDYRVGKYLRETDPETFALLLKSFKKT